VEIVREWHTHINDFFEPFLYPHLQKSCFLSLNYSQAKGFEKLWEVFTNIATFSASICAVLIDPVEDTDQACDGFFSEKTRKKKLFNLFSKSINVYTASDARGQYMTKKK
jgi:hypothetical protein